MKLPVLYLHGFGSSPQSTKAAYLGHRFRSDGRRVVVPDLVGADFKHMTISGILDIAAEHAAGLCGPCAVAGSSLGGYVAALLAAIGGGVRGLFLMAPAFDHARIWKRDMTAGQLAKWRETGELVVDYHAKGAKMPLAYGFLSDAERHPPFPDIGALPCAIVHGENDAVVPIALSEEFARRSRNAVLHRVPDDHELKASLPEIGRLADEFLIGLDGAP